MRKFAVVGSGISYTLSPLIHGEIFKVLNVRASYSVEDIGIDKLGANIKRLLKDYDGFNVTKPFKIEIKNFVKSYTPAINTVLSIKKQGYNTDGYGFISDFMQLVGEVAGKKVLIIGTGGAGEVVAEELTRAGAELYIYNRTAHKAKRLARRLEASADYKEACSIIVNCTSLTDDGEWEAILKQIDTSKVEFAYDLIYNQETAFLKHMQRLGVVTRDGIGMLVNQAIKAEEIFLNRTISPELADKIKDNVREKLHENINN